MSDSQNPSSFYSSSQRAPQAANTLQSYIDQMETLITEAEADIGVQVSVATSSASSAASSSASAASANSQATTASAQASQSATAAAGSAADADADRIAAAASASAAASSATSATGSAISASSSASAAATSATNATTSATAAQGSATVAASSASGAATAATNATASATAAATSATNAASSATAAQNSATAASTSASAASASATAAGTSASAASTSATNAATSATAAAASASAASSSQSAAATSATNAADSASAAATSQSQAATSATNAETARQSAAAAQNAAQSARDAAITARDTATSSATSASSSASAAATSATNAAASATSASGSATAAASSATTADGHRASAQTAATTASGHATTADNARIAAQAAQVASEAALDSFDDRYLGPKSSAPTLDNDGNTLNAGALYWDTSLGSLRVWSGSAWNSIQPGVTQTEGDARYLRLAGGTLTGALAVPAGSASAPSIAPTGDSNTGIYFPAADTIAFGEGGVEALRLDSSGNARFAGTAAMASSFLRNRLINGDMRIDQRNTGASVTVNDSSGNVFSVDRWQGAGETSDGVFTLQRSTVAPAGFTNSLLATVTTADASVGASQRYFIQQRVEGFNSADFGWGAAGALSVTLSFWVRSSVTGTFGGSLRNSAGNRSYSFSYSISAANTWEYKTIAIAGDTSGTWLTDNGIGVMVTWGLGVGSSLSGTAGAWAGAGNWSATGATNLMATNGATFYLTGTQLEVGAATPYERRMYGHEIALCQRYYAASVFTEYHVVPAPNNTFLGVYRIDMPVQMRGNPTMSVSYSATNAINAYGWYTQNQNFAVHYITASANTNAYMFFVWTASAEL